MLTRSAILPVSRPAVGVRYSVSRRRPGRSTCRFHRLHRIDIEVRAAQSTDPIVYAVAPVPSRVRRESLFEPQYRTYGIAGSGRRTRYNNYYMPIRIGRDEDRAVRGPGRVPRGGAVSSAEPADHAPGRPAPARGWTAAPFWLLQPYRAFRCLSRAVSSIDHA